MSLLHGEYRRHNRKDIRTSVSIGLQGNQLDTTTVDISESGIAINKPSQLNMAVGQSVFITFSRIPYFKVSAKIVRTSDDSIGLELNQFRFSESDINGIVYSAPWYEQLRFLGKRFLWKSMRRTFILLANTVFRQLILKVIKPKFLFAVYGNEKDVGTYLTARMLKKIPPLMLAGFIQNRGNRGIMVASKFFEHELAHDSCKVNLYLQQLQDEFPSIQTIALVGRLPNFVMKAGHEIKPPYVDGSFGTRYMIWDVGQQMCLLPEYMQETTICVLGGAGRIGSLVCEDLTSHYSTVIAFDSRYQQEEYLTVNARTILQTGDPSRLKAAKLYIALTHHGDVITEFMTHIPEGSLIADDTHPCISYNVRDQLKALNITVKKIVLFHQDFIMWPRMPAWSNRAIPGCLVEALVLLNQQNEEIGKFDLFCREARATGFQGQIVTPLEE